MSGLDIDSDGSALENKYRGLARGAGAEVQRTKEGGWRGYNIRVPFGLPKGAAVPEQLAASLALKKCAGRAGDGGQVSCIVTDCEAVMKDAGSLPLKCHHKSLFGGLWWDLPWNRAFFKKVRSHQPEEKVGKPGEISKEDWDGNSMADEWAGRGVPSLKDGKKARGIRAIYGKAGDGAKELATI